jgi:hypothetical protein
MFIARHSSATPRKDISTTPDATSTRCEQTSNLLDESTLHQGTSTPREEKSTQREKESDNSNSTFKPHIIDASLKRRARMLITNSSIPSQTRSLIRYALEIKDPYLAQVVRRVEAGEMTIDSIYLEQP